MNITIPNNVDGIVFENNLTTMTQAEVMNFCIDVTNNIISLKTNLAAVLTLMIIVNIVFFIYILFRYYKCVVKK